MKDFFSVDGPFATIANFIGDFMAISVLWVVFSLPIVTMGPAALAAYSVSIKVLRKQEGHVFRCFIEVFKQYLKKGIFFSISYFVLAVICLIDGYFFYANREVFQTSLYLYLLLLAGIFLLCNAAFLFPCMLHYDLSIWKLWKISVVLQFRYFFLSLLFLIMFAVGIFMLFFQPWSLIVLPGVLVYIYTFPMEWVLAKYK